MISTRRIVAAVGLAAGVTGLAAPLANAAEASAPDTGRLSPMAAVDSLAVTGIPEQYQGQIPRVSEQARALNQANQLWQVAAPAEPVLGLLPAVQG
ncbi:hypothetical protein ACF073_09860 [Streptomyces sp. NPDC015171]|uniref:hypothetical protein n=1 Tax=Streptomyces sp. NPDC015171 TaxID=3364945 RepID=UPI0036F95C68